MKKYYERQAGEWKGILVISSGRDYFAAGKYENKAYDQTPEKDFLQALQNVYNSLKEEQEVYKYLYHLVVLRGKDLAKAITYPSLRS